MGGRMARRLRAAGRGLVVHDPDRAASAALEETGATACSDPREVADRAHTVLVSLPSPQIVREVAAGDRGLIGGTAMRLYVDLSTTGPAVAREVGDAMAQAGVGCVDAPVSGGPKGAESGTLTLMLAGAQDSVAAARPILEQLGSRLFVVGAQPGDGQTAKVINNLLSASALAATAEALALGARAGLAPATLLEVLNASTGASNASTTKFPEQVLTRRFDHGFRLELMAKDARLCLEEAQRRGVPMLLGATVAQLWTLAEGWACEGADCTEIARLIEQWAGVRIEPAAQAPVGDETPEADPEPRHR
jgi:3-hydroxyisobutyrate dehydrogenase-like beta-hydroxyacid dehydrogenase